MALSPGGAAARRAEVDRFSPEAYATMAIGEAVTAELMSGLMSFTPAISLELTWS